MTDIPRDSGQMSHGVADGGEKAWFAVRCVFRMGWPPDLEVPHYEERITLWHSSSADEAIARAEAEALEYVDVFEESADTYLGLAQSFHLDDSPGDGAEIFSLIRASELGPDDYQDAFFDTGTERQRSDD